MEIIIGTHFSKFPGGAIDGPYSGKNFREKFLVPALKENTEVTVILDGTMGFSSVFLKEVFEKLITVNNFSLKELKTRLKIISNEDVTLATEAMMYLESAENRGFSAPRQ